MEKLSERAPRSKIGRALGTAAVALLCVSVLSQPNLAHAGPHGGGGGFHGGGGGGFHGGGGGGFRGGAGGFHGGGFHPAIGGFAGEGFHGGGFHGERHGGFPGSHNGFGDRHGGRLIYFPDAYGAYPYGGYYDYGQPSPSQTWYYCSDPAGYYPYVTQCNTSWQAVPG
jgi:hypothetical protein